MNKTLWAAWIALSIFWTGVAVQAQEHAQHGGEQPQASARAAPTGAHAEMWAQLTQEQQKSLQDLQQNAFRQTYPLVLQLRAKRAQLVAALAQENVDTDAVNQLVDEMNQIRTSIDKQRVDMVLRIKDMGLPPEMFGRMLMTHGMKGLMSPGMRDGSGMGMMGGRGKMGGMHGGMGMMGRCMKGGMHGGQGMGMTGGGMKGGMHGGMMGQGSMSGPQMPMDYEEGFDQEYEAQ